MDPITLRGPRTVLRAPRQDDVDAVYAACQDPEIARWTTVPSPYRRRDAEFFVRQVAERGWRDGSDAVFLGFEDPGDRLVGAVSLHGVREDRCGVRMAEVGYWTAKEMRGRGLTTEAVRLVCGWGFASLELARIEWYAEVGNDASRRVAEKAGFTVEGTLRGRMRRDGAGVDAWVGGLLPGDIRE